MGIKERKDALAREQAQLADEERQLAWAETETLKYSATEKRRLLAYLAEWVKTQPGHGVDCNCGECD